MNAKYKKEFRVANDIWQSILIFQFSFALMCFLIEYSNS